MKFTPLLFGFANGNKIIKNINYPACRNCIYYKPNMLNTDFVSTFNTCHKFGDKNIITDEITYKFADLCRNDETMCGQEGKYFEKDTNIKVKFAIHKIISNLPRLLILLTFVTSFVASIIKSLVN